MAKLVLSLNGTVIQQYFVDKEKITLGRGSESDVVIDDAAASREHAVIATIGNDQIIEDLQSSNGTFINGARIGRQILQHGDVIEIGPYSVRYLNPKQAGAINLEHTMLIEPLADDPGDTREEVSGMSVRAVKAKFPKGGVKFLFGPRASNTLELNRVIATFGTPGKQFAVITRRPMGYFITHVDGAYPLVNSESIGKTPRALKPNDVIVAGDDTLEFFLIQEPQ